MQDPRIAFIAIRSGDGDVGASDKYEAIVVGSGEDGNDKWRYAIFDLPQLRKLFTAAAEARRLGAPAVPHPLSNQTDVLAQDFGARWYETGTNGLLGAAETSAYVGNSKLAQIQRTYLAQKVNNATLSSLALPLRNIVKIIFYRNIDDAKYGQPDYYAADNSDHQYYNEDRPGGPLAVFDTCRNVIAKGGTHASGPPQKFQEQDTAVRSRDRLGSRLFLQLDSSSGKGALTCFALFAQVRLALNGHDLEAAPAAQYQDDTRGFIEAYAFPDLQQNGNVITATPRSLWRQHGEGATFDVVSVGFSLSAYSQPAIKWSEYSNPGRGLDLTQYRTLAVNKSSPMGYISVLESLGLNTSQYQNTYVPTRNFGIRTVAADVSHAGSGENGQSVQSVAVRLEAQITGPGPYLKLAFGPALPPAFADIPDDVTLYFAQEQPLGSINWSLSPATAVRWIFTARFRLNANDNNGSQVTAAVINGANAIVDRLHAGLRRVKDFRPLSFTPLLQTPSTSNLDWHCTGYIVDRRPFDRTVVVAVGGRKMITAGFLTLEPRFIADMWSGFRSQGGYFDSAVATFSRVTLTGRAVPRCVVAIHGPQKVNPTEAELTPCAKWPAWQPAVSAVEPRTAPRGTVFGVTITTIAPADPDNLGIPTGELNFDWQKLRIGALQMTLANQFPSSDPFDSELGYTVAGCVRITPFQPANDWDGDKPYGAVGIDARIYFPIAAVGPGDQDPLPNAGSISTDQFLADPLADPLPDPDVPLIFPLVTSGPATRPIILVADEAAARSADHTIALSLRPFATASPVASPVLNTALIIDPKPFRVAVVGYQDLTLAQSNKSDEIAVWNDEGGDGLSWRIVDDDATVRLLLPPQVIGEAMEKNASADLGRPKDVVEQSPAAVRFGSPTRLDLDPAYFAVRYVEPGWNLRRLFGYPGQRSPGVGLRDLRLELIYGMITRLTPAGVSIAEIGATLGAPATVPESEQETVQAYLALLKRFHDAEGRRLAADKLWSGGPELDLTIDDGAAFHLRLSQTDDKGNLTGGPITPLRWPFPGGKPGNLPANLANSFSDLDDDTKSFPGGISWAFESPNILRSVYGDTESDGGFVKGVYLSALGGWGEQRALFDEKRQMIGTVTTMGRVQRYALERVGRIGCLWNRAKHVIVYERTVVPAAQFYTTGSELDGLGKQQDELRGRPVLRKVEEYVQLLEPLRRYPESGNALANPGCMVGVEFKSIRINVNSRWGGDVRDQGWEVPLWNKRVADPDPSINDPKNPDSPCFIYPKPHIRVLLAGASGTEIAREIDEPEKLVFYSSVEKGQSGDNTDLWHSVRDIDFVDLPLPQSRKRKPVSADLTDAMLPPEPDHVPGYEQFTIGLVPTADAAAIAYGRQDSGPVAVLKNVTIARAAAQQFDPTKADAKAKVAQQVAAATVQTRTDFDRVAQSINVAAQITDDVKDAATVTKRIGAALNSQAARDALQNVINNVPPLPDALKIQPGTSLCAAQVEKIKTVSGQQIDRAHSTVTQFLDDLGAELDDAVALAGDFQNTVNALPSLAQDDLTKKLKVIKDQAKGLLAGLSMRLNDLGSTAGIALNQGRANAQQIVDEAGGRVDALRQQLTDPVFTQADTALGNIVTAANMAAAKALCDPIVNALRPVRSNIGALIADVGEVHLPESAKRTLLAADGIFAFAQNQCIAIKSLADTALATAKQYATDARGKLAAFRDALDKRAGLGSGSDVASKLGGAIDGIAGLLQNKLKAASTTVNGVIAAAGTQIDAIAVPDPTNAPAVQAFCTQLSAQIDPIVTNLRAAAASVKQALAVGSADLKPVNDAITQAQTDLIAQMQSICGAIDGELETLYQAEQGAQDWIKSTLADYTGQVQDALDQLTQQANETLDDFAQRAQDTVNQVTGDMEARGRELLGTIQSRATDLLGQDPAAVFQQGSDTLRLLRAVGDPPKSDMLGYNRPQVAYIFNEANKFVDMSPAVALVNRVGDSFAAAQAAGQAVDNLLTSFGIRLPLSAIGDQLMPDALKDLDISKLFSDFSGLKLDGLLQNVGFPDLNDSDAIKIRHGFDPTAMRAWLEADVNVPFADSAPIFEFGPVQVIVDGAQFTAQASLSAGRSGTEKHMHGSITGDWQVVACGQTILTFVQTGLFFDDSGKLQFNIQPERVELAEVLQFLTSLIEASGQTGGLQIVPYMRGSIPAGVAASLDLPLPDLQTGVFGISHLSLHVLFGVLAVPSFELVAELGVAAKTAPFTLNVWLLNGGGFLTSRLSYLPTEKPHPLLTYSLEIGIVAGVGLGFNYGVISGGVWIEVGASISILWTTQGGGSSTAVHVFILVAGNVDVAGLITASIALLMDVSYDGSVMIGSGSLDFAIKISVFYTFHVSQHVEYQFAGSNSKKQVGSYSGSHE